MGRQGVLVLLLAMCGVSAGGCALSGAKQEARSDRPRLLAPVAYMGSLSASLAYVLCSLNRGAETWQEAQNNHIWQSVLVALVPAALALFSYRAALRLWSNHVVAKKSKGSPIALVADERVFWSSTAFNPWLLCVGGLYGFFLLRGSLPFTSEASGEQSLWLRSPLLVLLVVLFDLGSRVSIQVDNRRVRLSYGTLLRVKQRFALNRIESATAVMIRPLAHGGWGYRGITRLFRTNTVVVRRGPGLELSLRGGRLFRVTVDSPQVGADLINGLSQRKNNPPTAAVGASV